jgi:hypothetical protein
MRDVFLQGAEAHWAPALVTFDNRVQIGLNLGSGFAVPRGEVEDTTNGQTTIFPAKDVLNSVIPLFNAEVQGIVIVRPGFKVKVSGGLNLPSKFAVRVAAVYLFGVR